MEHGGAVPVMFGDELAVHSVALDVPDALLAPAGYGYGVDERFFESGRGTEFIVETGDEIEESLGFLAAQEHMGRENAMFDCVAGGGEFAVGRDRSAGLASVGAGSLELKWSAHLAVLLSHAGEAVEGSESEILLILREI
jgi:hypothetical protein